MPMIRVASIVVLLCLSLPAFACEYPDSVEIPNGATATRDEMLAAQQDVKDYIAAMEVYLACIAEEEEALLATQEQIGMIDDEELINRSRALTLKHNDAVEQMELVAARFNEEVRIVRDPSE